LFKQDLIQLVERLVPGTICTIGDISYGIPLTLSLTDIRLAQLQSPTEVLFFAKRITINADPRRLGRIFHIVVDAYDGVHQCQLRINKDSRQFTLADLSIQHLDLGQFILFHRGLGRKWTGFLDISGQYSGQLGKIESGVGTGTMVVRNGAIELRQPILSLDVVNLQTVQSELQLQGLAIAFKKGVFHGLEFNGEFSGMFQINSPWKNSKLELAGGFEPLPSLLRGDPQWKNMVTMLQRRYKQTQIPFVVNGTVAEPVLRFGG